MLNTPVVIVCFSISAFHSISFCFTYFAALLFGVYTFRIAMSSCWTNPLSLWYLSLVIFFALKFSLSDNSIANPVFLD